MSDENVVKLISKLTKSLVTKEDLKALATKEDLKSLATKEELKVLASKEDIKKLKDKIDYLNTKADTILEFAEAVDETTMDHEKRLKRIEKIPAVAHQLKLKS